MRYAGPEEVENIINARDRHCRIGKVTRKAKHVIPSNWWKHTVRLYEPATWTDRKCSCRPGQVCGNVACPHMLTVYNATFPAVFA